MKEVLKHKLHHYIRENNLDMLLTLEANNGVTKYMSDKVDSISELLTELENENKPDYIIEEMCLNEMIKDLKPSKFNYIAEILEQEFEFAFQQLSKLKLLQYEVLNILVHCEAVFESFNFNEENEDNRELRYAVTGIIGGYLDGSL